MAKAAAAQATVTLKHLAAALAETHEMAKKQSELILNDLVDLGPVLSWAEGGAGVHVVGGRLDHIRIGRRTDRNRMRNAVR